MKLIDSGKMLVGAAVIVVACSGGAQSGSDGVSASGGTVGAAMADPGGSGGSADSAPQTVSADCVITTQDPNDPAFAGFYYATAAFPGASAAQLAQHVHAFGVGNDTRSGYQDILNMISVADGSVSAQCGVYPGAVALNIKYKTVQFIYVD